jgi:hypothetical protein
MRSFVAACVLLCLALGVSAQAPGQWISGTATHTNGPEVSDRVRLRAYNLIQVEHLAGAVQTAVLLVGLLLGLLCSRKHMLCSLPTSLIHVKQLLVWSSVVGGLVRMLPHVVGFCSLWTILLTALHLPAHLTHTLTYSAYKYTSFPSQHTIQLNNLHPFSLSFTSCRATT